MQCPNPPRFDEAARNTKDLDKPTMALRNFLMTYGTRVSAPKAAIDLGAGGGRDTRALLRKGWQVKAVDTSSETALALANEDRSRLQVIQGTLFDAEIASASIDLVNAQRVFPYIRGKERMQYLSKIRDLLKPGGYLLRSRQFERQIRSRFLRA